MASKETSESTQIGLPLSETTETGTAQEERREQERVNLLQAVSAGKLDTLQGKVAWILNHYPSTRDSDIRLQLEYWEAFQPELLSGEFVRKQDLFQLTRLTTLTRARAKIQNTYRLFVASPEVRKQRGTLSDEERDKAGEQRPPYPLFAVYADESGKTGKFLIVGSVWFLHPPEILSFMRTVSAWRTLHKFEGEFHFSEISSSKLPYYLAFADLLIENSTVLSFKAVSVERAGIKSVETALEQLYYLLLIRGVEHEHSTGRAPLPRGIQLWKDLEELGKDKLFLASLEDELRQAATTRFNDQLFVDDLEAIDSKGQILVQIADLYTSSINRVLNAEGKREGPKDQFADYFLTALRLPHGPISREMDGDISYYASL